jgi:GntR family transcriptional repressor for pyruvate dehydrogenase complex
MNKAPGTSGALTTVLRISPTQQVREQLLEAIEQGVYPIDTLLPSERALCDAFGVSRVSVREALAGLEALGVIQVQHGKGAFVRDQTGVYATSFGQYLSVFRDDILELLRVRQALDEMAAAQAAERPEPTLRAAMQEACAAFRIAAEAEQPKISELALRDEEFHLAVANASGGKLLPKLTGELNGVLKPSRRMTFAHEGQIERSVIEHNAIVDAILANDAAGARKAAGEHIEHLCEWISSEKDPAFSASPELMPGG